MRLERFDGDLLDLEIVGDITKTVRNSAIPTIPGWAARCVPTPVRMKPSTIMMRVKPVTVNSTAGHQRQPGEEQQDLDGVAGAEVHGRTVIRARARSDPTVPARDPLGPRRGASAGRYRPAGPARALEVDVSSAVGHQQPASRASSSV